MIEFVLALGMMGIVIALVTIAVVWAIREHIAAKKYRFLVRLKNTLPPDLLRTPINKGSGRQWRISYKDKSRLKEFTIDADNEKEAIGKFIRTGSGVGFNSIVKVEKV